MVTYDFGDVVIVPFPFVDYPVSKPRPAPVVSNANFNAINHHTVLAMITTAARSHWPSDIEIAELGAAGLQHRSVIRWKLFSVPNSLIDRQIGRLRPGDREATGRLIGQSFGTTPRSS
jgi:mRNA interferase MazF